MCPECQGDEIDSSKWGDWLKEEILSSIFEAFLIFGIKDKGR